MNEWIKIRIKFFWFHFDYQIFLSCHRRRGRRRRRSCVRHTHAPFIHSTMIIIDNDINQRKFYSQHHFGIFGDNFFFLKFQFILPNTKRRSINSIIIFAWKKCWHFFQTLSTFCDYVIRWKYFRNFFFFK